MAGPIVKDTDVARDVRGYYDRNFIENARPYEVHRQFAQTKKLPNKSSKTIHFRKMNTLAKATTPLVEGVTPSGSTLAVTEQSATVKQYGDYIPFSDHVDLIAEDPILTKFSMELGEQAGLTADTLARDVLVAGTNVIYANGSARTDVNTEMSLSDIKTSIRFFRSQKAKPIKERIKPSGGIGTEALRPGFFAIIHHDIIPTIEALTGFINSKNYPDNGKIMENEIGAVDMVRFVWTTESKVFLGGGTSGSNVKSTGGDADVYATIILARDAFGTVLLEGGSLETIVKAIGSAGAADPLNQRGTMGWKMWDAVTILNQAFIIRIESAGKDTL